MKKETEKDTELAPIQRRDLGFLLDRMEDDAKIVSDAKLATGYALAVKRIRVVFGIEREENGEG